MNSLHIYLVHVLTTTSTAVRELFYPYHQIASLLSLEAIVVLHESFANEIFSEFSRRDELFTETLVFITQLFGEYEWDETLHQWWWRNYTLYSKSPLQRNALRGKSSLVNICDGWGNCALHQLEWKVRFIPLVNIFFPLLVLLTARHAALQLPRYLLNQLSAPLPLL